MLIISNTVRKFSLALGIVIFQTLTLVAQDDFLQNDIHARELSPRKQRAEKRKIETGETAKAVGQIVERRVFVLQADYIMPLNSGMGREVLITSPLQENYVMPHNSLNRGRINVSRMLNFIAVDSSRITIQLANDRAFGGLNDMGGLTTDGKITKYDISRSGKSGKNYRLHVIAATHVGDIDIFFDISPDTRANATLGNMTRYGRLSYIGFIVPPEQAKIYKTMSM
jgi:hypothetical protein